MPHGFASRHFQYSIQVMVQANIQIKNVSKIFPGGFQALKGINLDIYEGEIFALLGPNGAGKTTLISIVCGLANATSGSVHINGFDSIKDYKQARTMVGLVPQELTTDAFETVWNTVNFTRGLFGLKPDKPFIEKILKDLSLWDKRNNRLLSLSGGMKRRLMIAKALSHEPRILFLDEPTAGVDVELRKGMWELVHQLKKSGVTIILTTHYIEEAEEMADRIGIINKGEIKLVEKKAELIRKLGTKTMTIELESPLSQLPISLKEYQLELKDKQLVFTYDSKKEDNGVLGFFKLLERENISFHDLNTKNSSLEEIFVGLINTK